MIGRYLMLILLIFPAIVSAQQIPDDKMILIKNDSPLIAFRIMFRTGSAFDPKGKEGLASLTATMLTEGATQKNEYQKILQMLYPMAASYTSQVDKEMTVIRGVVHKDYVDTYYALLRDAILTPGFKQDDFDRLKTDQVNTIARTLRYNDDEELTKEVLRDEIYEGQPYGHPNDGTVKSATSLTLDDVKNFYAQQFTQKNLSVGIAGNYPESLVAQIKKDFGSIRAGEQANAAQIIPAPKEISGIHAVLIEKDTAGTAISFGFPIKVNRSNEDYYALMIMNAWLGQHRNSFAHLYQVMREIRGLNYGDYSYIEWFAFGGRTMLPFPNFARHQQLFEIWIRPVQNQNRHFALRQAVRELQKLIDNGMTQEDFQKSRNFLLNYNVNLAQSNSDQLGYALDDRFFGLDQPYLEKIKSKLSSIKPEDVDTAIKKYLNAKNMVIVVVTKDAQNFKDSLSQNKPSPISYESPKPASVLEEDKEIINYPIDIPAENIRIIPVDQLFE
ncbi:insulinase family protein [bacterium]|nr:insulinase family protein [bacterium]